MGAKDVGIANDLMNEYFLTAPELWKPRSRRWLPRTRPCAPSSLPRSDAAVQVSASIVLACAPPGARRPGLLVLFVRSRSWARFLLVAERPTLKFSRALMYAQARTDGTSAIGSYSLPRRSVVT